MLHTKLGQSAIEIVFTSTHKNQQSGEGLWTTRKAILTILWTAFIHRIVVHKCIKSSNCLSLELYGWWFLKWGRKDCVLGCHWPACTVGVWWNRNVRLKLFQGVLVNYKRVRRDSYVNKIDTKPPVASLLFESWWAACLWNVLQGQKERMQSPYVKSGLLLICKSW